MQHKGHDMKFKVPQFVDFLMCSSARHHRPLSPPGMMKLNLPKLGCGVFMPYLEKMPEDQQERYR